MSETQKLFLSFYDIQIEISSNSSDLLYRLTRDFSFFKRDNLHKVDILIRADLVKPPLSSISGKKTYIQFSNSTTWEDDNKRFNDYKGELLSIYDFNSESGEIYSEDLERLHEITYLMILSRSGKKMDLRGLHKVHACSVEYSGNIYIFMMPMKGGKSTLLWNLLKDSDLNFVSDDTPLVSRGGEIRPFPIRIGFENPVPSEEVVDPSQNMYSLMRKKYGQKYLISVEGIKNKISSGGQRIYLFNAYRTDSGQCKISRINSLAMFKHLFKNQVIGVGLPIIIEYFWEFGLRDFCRKTYIFASRMITAIRLIMKSKIYEVELGTNPADNSKFILDWIKKQSD